MKILRIIYDWPPPWQGLSPAPYELTKSQVVRGHEFYIFCGRWPKAGPIERVEKTVFYPIIRAPLQGTIALTSSIILFFKYLAWRKNHEIDLIHSHGHFAIWIYLYRHILGTYFPWLKEMQTPLIVHFHNTVKGRQLKLEESEKEIKAVSKFFDWPLAQFSDQLAVKTAAACIFVSEDLKQEAIKYYGVDPKKCYVVESGFNKNNFRPAGPDEIIKSKIELNIEPVDKVIVNVGALVERKNIHLLVESLELLPRNYKLMLVGNGDASYVDRLNLLIADKKLKDRVIRVGYSPYPQIPIAYQVADLFVLPSSFEGLPKVAIESLACGTPVLASGFSLSEDIRGISYLTELTAEKIAEKIKEMIENPPEVNVYKIIQNYTWDIKAAEIDKIYEVVKREYLK